MIRFGAIDNIPCHINRSRQARSLRRGGVLDVLDVLDRRIFSDRLTRVGGKDRELMSGGTINP